MEPDLTLGVVAHHGGLLVRRPELSVGVVQAMSRPSGLTLDVIARRPLDRRDAKQRQRDIRSVRDEPVRVAPRLLLPDFDEGRELRLGWIEAGHAHWAYGDTASWSGDDHTGSDGPGWRHTCLLPPMFEQLSLVLAWPEIGFDETVVTVELPDRDTVERAATSIWQAPVDALPVTEPLTDRHATHLDPVPIEAGTVVAAPRVLHRSDHAAIVLSRVTAVGPALSLELTGVVTGPLADTLARRAPRGGPSMAVAEENDAFWLRSAGGSHLGGKQHFVTVDEFTAHRPDGDVLDLVVAWSAAGLSAARARVSCGRSR